jgi:hypothetical protein
MTQTNSEERARVLRRANAAFARGDVEEAVRLTQSVPLLPEEARAAKQAFGVEWLRESGFNLTAAEEAYGKDWLLS